MKVSFGLKTQAVLASAFLLVIPVAGYYQVRHYSEHLLAGQRSALLATARQVSAVVEQSSQGILKKALMPGRPQDPARDLYAYPLAGPVTLDGKDDDWRPHLDHFRRYGANNIIEVYRHYTEDTLHFYLLVGEHRDFLYVFARVIDNRVVYREVGSLSVHRNDHLQFAIVDPSGNYNRYTIAPMQPGLTSAFKVTPAQDGSRAIREEPEIRAMWLATEQGYNVEARIPLALVSHQMAITVTDVDDPDSRQPVVTIGTASTTDRKDIGTLLIPSRTLREVLDGLEIRYTRLRLLDAHGRLVAQSGDIAGAEGLWHRVLLEPPHDAASTLLGPIISPFLPRINPDVVDQPADEAHIAGENISSALAGNGQVAERPSGDGTATILSAAWPLHTGGGVAGVVVAEQTTNGAITLTNRLAVQILGAAMLIVVAGAVLMSAFAAVLALRIRRLRLGLEAATDPQGRVREQLPTSSAHDELGRLARSFSGVAARLRQYNRYLEDMARQLSHELRTPITVIRSSLDNLSMQQLDDESEIYVARAHEGVQRLSTILTNMTEATRLEESLNTADMEFFDLTEVVRGCVKGYELAYPDQAFELSIEDDFDKVNGLPELIAQMLDKLVSNAVEFATPGTPVKIRLTRERDAVLRVINNGPALPDDVKHRLFDSMISVRQGSGGEGSHLGLGLYIARIIAEFHGGTISAHNREDAEGVIVTVRLPIMRLTARS